MSQNIEVNVSMANTVVETIYCPTCHRSAPDVNFLDTKDTRILVTGGYGFIGSSFINYIMDTYTQIHVTNIDAMYYCANEVAVDAKHRTDPRYKFIKANVADKDMMQYLVNDIRPTHVIHFAAQSHVDGSFVNSLQYTRDNVLGTHTLMDCLLEYYRDSTNDGAVSPLQKIIHVSTDEVYGDSMLTMENQGKHEQSILCPTNPYAAARAGAELIASSYYHSSHLPIIITRANNVYGPDQHPEKLIPRFISLLKRGEPVTIAGTGKQRRTFLHTSDICRAFDCILQKGALGEIYNIGSEAEHSVMEVAEMLIDLMYSVPMTRVPYGSVNNSERIGHTRTSQWKHVRKEFITFMNDRPYNDKSYLIHDDKIRALGWTPQMKFMDGLKYLIQSTNIHVPHDKPWLVRVPLPVAELDSEPGDDYLD